MKKTVFIAVIISFLNIPLVYSGNWNSKKPITSKNLSDKEKLETFLKIADSIREKLNVPGVGISIIKDNKVLYSGGLGYSNLSENKKVDGNTLFSIGSCTKSFTGVLTAKLVEKGLLDWHKPLKSYITNLKLKEQYIEDNLTVLDALSHGTGLAKNTAAWKYKNYTRDKLLGLLAQQDFSTAFRASYNYNNMMFAIGGLASEKVTGESWETLIKNEIFEPMQMNDSYTRFDEFIVHDNRAIGYQKDGFTVAQPVDVTVIAPTGAISSTPIDMSKWLSFFANNGQHNNTVLLQPKSYDFIAKPHKNVSVRNGDEIWYYYAGIGGFLKNGKRNIGHNGAIDGQNSRMVIRPEEGFAIMIMTNQLSEYKELIVNYAEEWFLEGTLTRQYERELGLEAVMHSYVIESLLDKGKTLEAINYTKKLDENRLGLILEANINVLGYFYMQNGKLDEALTVFKLNAEKFPNSTNVFNSLGEAYYQKKTYQLALEAFETSLKHDPNNQSSKDFITRIKNKN
ncbi:serine hydrolase [Winogradskyella flava]|uniref:Serine hydrolase n=1 Tax=Winogradskyella flava TaxID=1884876 RepID=A0A842ISD1_9FLAO|nr:serine hydrolase [Winogradskyella flava]MBC2845791.1 serine hydrolase [Winogradskyella flava]